MKRIIKKVKKKLGKYINLSARGSISLFMAILLAPFFSIAGLLVEVERANSAAAILRETMGLAAYSTLAEEDSYLHKRWGLHAYNQKNNMEESYQSNLSSAELLGKTLELTDTVVTPKLDLGNDIIFEQQLEEYCKLNSPTSIAFQFGNIADLLSQFEKIGNIDKLLKIATDVSETADGVKEMLEAVEEAKESAETLEKAEEEFDKAYEEFYDAVDDLIDEIEESEDGETEETEESGESEGPDTSDAEKKQESYSEKIQVVIEAMEDYSTDLESVSQFTEQTINNAAGVVKNSFAYAKEKDETSKELKEKQNELRELERSTYQDAKNTEEYQERYTKLKKEEESLREQAVTHNMAYSAASAEEKAVSTIAKELKQTIGDYQGDVFEEVTKSLEEIKTSVDEFDLDTVSSDEDLPDKETYWINLSDLYLNSSELDSFLEKKRNELVGGSLGDVLDGVVAAYETFFKCKGIYDPVLCTKIDTGFYNSNIGGLPGNSAQSPFTEILETIGNLIEDAGDLSENLMSLKLIEAIESICDLISDVIAIFTGLYHLVLSIINNVNDVIAGNLGDRFLFSAYSAYNLPCRTDVSAGHVNFTCMTGYKLKKGSLPDNSLNAIPSLGLVNLINLVTSKSGTIDENKKLTFTGAELEYILSGNNSEVTNQVSVFFSLYLMRLLLDSFVVAGDAEIQAIADAAASASFGIGYPVVIALFILAEPVVDTLLLVNGSKVKFIKSDVYLSPSGLPGLIQEFISMAVFTNNEIDKMKNGMVEAFGASVDDYDYSKYQRTMSHDSEPVKKDSGGVVSKAFSGFTDGLLKFDYREYCFLMSLLFVTKGELEQRLQNLVQMETMYHYRTEEPDRIFDLNKAYTYMDISVNAKMKPLLPTLIEPEKYNFNSSISRGY